MKRLNFRITFKKYILFIMLSKRQTLEGVTSKVIDEPEEKHLHYIFWDLENCTLDEAIKKLAEIQYEFKLGDIYITSDCEGSYRAWCFSKRQWITYLHILIESFPLLDYGFWVWTVRRGSATLRTSQKENRPKQEILFCLNGYEFTTIPDKMIQAIYDTGIEKRGKVITIG